MKPQRIRLSRKKGWRLPPNAVNVARPGPWGNPFVVGPGMTRAEAVRLHELMMGGYICMTRKPSVDEQREAVRYAIANIDKLHGKDLACWCALDGGPCHADLLLRAANRPRRKKAT